MIKLPKIVQVKIVQAKIFVTAILAMTLAPGCHFLGAQDSPRYGLNANACQLMPTADLESKFGGKATHPHGTDGDSSICTLNIGSLAVKLQSAAPGTGGVPTSIRQGLMGAKMMLSEAKQGPKTNTKDYGKIGCLSIKMTKGFDGKPLAKTLFTTSCFLVEGGYLNMSVSGENSKQGGFDVVKGLLEKAAALR